MKWLIGVYRSFVHAGRGLLLAFRTERSFRIQVAVGMCVGIALFLFPFRTWERILLLLAIALVFVLELLNSMVERLVDLVKPRMHGYVHDIKDLMAATVLVASCFAALIGLLIVWPYLDDIVSRL